MAASYSSIRRQHLVFALRSLTRRQQTALLLVAAILGPTSVGIMQGGASALDAFVARDTTAAWRAVAWLAWFLATGLIVLALREAVFMLAARPFVRMLPISRGAHLACDIRSIAIAYSFLWLPIAFFLWTLWSSARGLSPKVDATLVVAVGLSIAMALQALALQGRPSAFLLAAVAAAAFCFAPSLAWPGSWLALLTVLALAALALAIGYEHPARSGTRVRLALPLASHVAALSGLALPVAWRDLRYAIGLRLAFIGLLLGSGAWLARDGAFCGRRTGLVLVESALIVLPLYRVPALVDARLQESLPWLFRLGRARRRAIGASALMTGSVFAAAWWAAAWMWRSECGAIASALIGWTFAVALGVVSLAAFRWKEASAWIAIVALLVLTFVLGEAL